MWEYFDKISTAIATCKLCKLKYKRCGNTTNLKDHLKRKHPVEWRAMNNEDSEVNEDNEIEPSVKKRNTVDTMLKRQEENSSWSGNSSRKQTLDKLYLNMIATDLQPLRFGEHSGFQKFIKGLEPRYIIPSRTYVKQTLLPREYERLQTLLRDELVLISHCAITTDIWTSKANEGILAITCHYITFPGKLKSIILEAVKLKENHTGDTICNVCLIIIE